jgi:transposase InsO family protein
MSTALALLLHFIVSLFKLARPGGARGLLAETLLVKQQLLLLQRPRRRAPNLTVLERVFAGLCCLMMTPGRIAKAAVVIRPATLLKFMDALERRKYKRLFSSVRRAKPGPKGPSSELVAAIVEMKTRNPRMGCPRIAQQISVTFGVEIDKDVVRRVLAKHFRPQSGGDGPSWLTFLGHMSDSLWSVDLFRCESILLRTHYVMVMMDQFSRRIIGFAVQGSSVDGPALCRMFYEIVARAGCPKRLSSDNDPLFEFHRWGANLRILGVEEIKTVPHVPMSHPFVERLIGTVRREYLDHVLFWNAVDLERKLDEFRIYYNEERAHASLDMHIPAAKAGGAPKQTADIADFSWSKHCGGLFELPIAA